MARRRQDRRSAEVGGALAGLSVLHRTVSRSGRSRIRVANAVPSVRRRAAIGDRGVRPIGRASVSRVSTGRWMRRLFFRRAPSGASMPAAFGDRSGSASSRRRGAARRAAGSEPVAAVRDVSRRPTRAPRCWPVAGSGGPSVASRHSLRPFATSLRGAVTPRLSLEIGVRPVRRRTPGARCRGKRRGPPGGKRRVAVHRNPAGIGASQQPDQARFDRDAIIAAQLSVCGYFVRYRGRLRAEPAHGEAAVVDVDADRAGEVAAGAAAENERRPVPVVTGPAEGERAAHDHAPGEQDRRSDPRPAVRMALALAFRSLLPPAGRGGQTQGGAGDPADAGRDARHPAVEMAPLLVAALASGGIEVRGGRRSRR